ncbi:MAG TPA: hypothetical protein VNM22_11200 [Candidatus Limnocylindrales bacterium]|nr:hypothetical protein [Candidatus Limnocylindrales bacterium]
MCGINVAHFTNQKKEVTTRLDEKADTGSRDLKELFHTPNGNDPKGLPEKPKIEEGEVVQKK